MASAELPAEARRRFETREALQAALREDHGIEVFAIEWADRRLIRPCCQVYNTAEQYRRLAEAVRKLCG